MYFKDAIGFSSPASSVVYNVDLGYIIDMKYSGRYRTYTLDSQSIRHYSSSSEGIRIKKLDVIPLKDFKNCNWQVTNNRNIALREVRKRLEAKNG